MVFSNRWTFADGTLHEKPIEIRFREQVDQEQASGQYGQCIQIAWNADRIDDGTGFPTPEELSDIDAFNQKLMTALEAEQHGILVMVLTSQGIVQWILYCRDLDEAQADLNTIPTDTGLYPIEVVADSDPEWDTYTQLRDAIKP